MIPSTSSIKRPLTLVGRPPALAREGAGAFFQMALLNVDLETASPVEEAISLREMPPRVLHAALCRTQFLRCCLVPRGMRAAMLSVSSKFVPVHARSKPVRKSTHVMTESA